MKALKNYVISEIKRLKKSLNSQNSVIVHEQYKASIIEMVDKSNKKQKCIFLKQQIAL